MEVHRCSDYTDSFGVQLDDGASIQMSFSTLGHTDVVLGYSREIKNFDEGEFFSAAYSLDQGLTWTEFDVLEGEDDWAETVFFFPKSTENRPEVRVKFETVANGFGAHANIDDVVVSTDVVAGRTSGLEKVVTNMTQNNCLSDESYFHGFSFDGYPQCRDTSYLQRRIDQQCEGVKAIKSINANGSVGCIDIVTSSSEGDVTMPGTLNVTNINMFTEGSDKWTTISTSTVSTSIVNSDSLTTSIARTEALYSEKIKAGEITVATNWWPDYVFDDNYHLMSLEKVEKYIKNRGHLPGLPTAKEVISGGISVGETQSKLLEKVEELTLYVIEQKKEIESLKRQLRSPTGDL